MKHIALISAKLKYIHSMYTYTHKQNTNKQIENHSLVSTHTHKKKKHKIKLIKLNSITKFQTQTYLSVCTNSIIDTKRNTAKTTIHSLVANRM